MKYVLILIVIVLLVRIDLILKFFDSTVQKFQSESSDSISTEGVLPNRELVPLNKDLTTKTQPRQIVLSMLSDFQSSADQNTKQKIIDYLKVNSTIFSESLDRDLESALYGLRNLVVQKNKASIELLLELLNIFKGENLETVKKVFSFLIDADLPEFLAINSKTSDVNCMMMTYQGDLLTLDEKFNESFERLNVLDSYLGQKETPPGIKLFGEKCRLVLNLELEKMKSSNQPSLDEKVAPVAEEGLSSDPGLSP